MKQDVRNYAKALAAVAAGPLSADKEKAILKNFTRILTAKVGRAQWPKFIAAAEKALRQREGLRKVTIETARSLGDTKHEFKAFLKASDIVEHKVDPAIIAGVKVTIDDSRQFDGSLARKLNKLF